jgi:hypothetical protein
MGPNVTETPAEAKRTRRLEVMTAALLSTAGLFSAWASYQASLWGGQQASHYALASAKVTEASRLSIVDGQLVGIDGLMFKSWLEAAADGDESRMNFFEHRFSPELKAVFGPWRARYPGDLHKYSSDAKAPNAFPRPVHKEGIEARALQQAADAELARGEAANGHSDRYVATTVVLSLVLFLGGISASLTRQSVRWGLLLLAAAIGVAAAIFILGLPVATL